MKEGERKEPSIIEILNEALKKGSNNSDDFPTVQKIAIAARMEIDSFMLNLWLADKRFTDGLKVVKETYEKDPWKDTDDEGIMLGAAVLSFGISIVLEETKKRYTV